MCASQWYKEIRLPDGYSSRRDVPSHNVSVYKTYLVFPLYTYTLDKNRGNGHRLVYLMYSTRVRY
jgi:hypothetical protein